jgi:hypothetical protein
MKKFVIIIFTLIFWNVNVFAKEEIRTTFGFYVTIPSNTIAVVGQDADELLREYTGPNSDAIKRALKAPIKNRNIDYILFQDIEDPENYSINISINNKGDLKKIASMSVKDLCSSVKKYMSEAVGKNIKIYDCEVTNKFSPKFQPAIFIYQDSLTGPTYLVQYQIQTSGGITTFTAGCTNNKTCELMKGHLSEMIKSIR